MSRPYLNGTHNSGVTSLATDGWPASTSNVLWSGDKILFAGDGTEYVVQASVNSNGSGQATVSISPGLANQKADDSPIMVPRSRAFASAMRSAVAAETGDIFHLMQFNFATIKDITGFADAGGGQITVSCASHGLSNGDSITIYGTSGYNGTYTVSNVAADTFRVTKAYVAGDSTGYLDIPNITYLATAFHNLSWDSKTWIALGGNLSYDVIREGSDLSGYGITLFLSGVDQTAISLILGKKYIGRDCKVWFAHMGSDGQIVADPKLMFWGKMNGGFEIRERRDDQGPGTVDVIGRMMDRFGELTLVRGIQCNVESHQRIFPGDEFFNQVPSLQTKTVVIKAD